MDCPTCGCCAIQNMANNKTFWYCRECKEEVSGCDELTSDDTYDDWGWPISNFENNEEGIEDAE